MNALTLSPRRLETFWARVDKGDGSGCWLWTGTSHPDGRGLILVNRRRKFVYRVAWELENGPIPEGLEIDHMCFTPACLRLDHLRLLTRSENAMFQPRYFQTHCKRGHEFTPENTHWQIRSDRRPSRRCKTCVKLHEQWRSDRQKLERKAARQERAS